MRLIDSFVESEAASNFLIGWIAQYCGAPTDQNGQVVNRQRKPIEHFLNLGITLEIDVGIRLVIASQKLFDAQGVKQVAGANQNDVTNFARNLFETTQDERSQKNIAEFTVGLDKGLQRLALDFDEL